MPSRLYLYSYVSLARPRNILDPPPLETSWVTVLLPIYNEPIKILNRLLKACTSFQYERYDILIADDSDDPETLTVLEQWKNHDKIRIAHRPSRDGFKGGALQNALAQLPPKTTHLLIFDADFLPAPHILPNLLNSFENDTIAAVQGHQSHSLNAPQNWITKAVHAAAAAGFTTDLSARGRLGSFIQLGGTAMMIRRDILDAVGGFKPHLTEDFELTLRLYLAGYKVLYREDLSVPAECPSRLLHLARQNLRWSQGITSAFTQHFREILKSPRLSKREKLDLFLFGTSHLQALLFTASNITLLTILLWFQAPPARTLLAATPIAAYLALSAPTSMAAGLYKDGSLRRTHWILYAILLSYLLVPFQAFGAMKGLFSGNSYWHRTPKTGMITDDFQEVEKTKPRI